MNGYDQAGGRFDGDELFDVIRSKGRSLELTEERFWRKGYGSETIHLLVNLWYRDFNYNPAYENNLPQVDHILPQSVQRKWKEMNPKTGKKDLVKYKEEDRNQLANCMLLTQQENEAAPVHASEFALISVRFSRSLGP